MWGEPAYRADAEALLGECASRDVGVMAIKAVAHRPWPGAKRKGSAWYEPFDEAAGIERGVRFALSTPGVHAFCTPGDAAILPLVLDAADHATPMSPAERTDASTGWPPRRPSSRWSTRRCADATQGPATSEPE